jgi:hypothetical protein
VEDGSIAGMLALSSKDVHRANKLFGTPHIHSKMTKKKVSRVIISDTMAMEEKKQTLYTDFMHLDGSKFLAAVCKSLELMMQCKVEREI